MGSFKRRIILATCLLGSALAQTPPLYVGVNHSTAPVGTLTAPFNANSTFNTVIFTPLNPTSNQMTLLSDKNWTCGNSTATNLSEGNVTSSGGWNDIMGSAAGTYAAVHVNGTNCIMHLGVNSVGALQNQTSLGENLTLRLPGMLGFSKVSDNVVYWLSEAHLLHQCTIINDATCMETKNYSFPFDYDTCPATGVAAGTKGISASILGIMFNDAEFSVDISWAGGQGTAHQAFAYSPGVGCAALDVGAGKWYAFNGTSGTETACIDTNFAGGQGIHDAQLSNDGNTMAIAGGAFNTGTDNFCFWQVGTGNAVGVESTSNHLAGHDSATGHFVIDAANPNPNIRVISPLTAADIQNFQILNSLPISPAGAGGYHGDQPHPLGTDLTPWIVESAGATDGTSYLTPEYLQNEIFGIPAFGSNQPILRFGETYNSGMSGTFGCGFGIGYVSQTGNYVIFLSDSLLNLGTDLNGKPMCYLVGLKLGAGL